MPNSQKCLFDGWWTFLSDSQWAVTKSLKDFSNLKFQYIKINLEKKTPCPSQSTWWPSFQFREVKKINRFEWGNAEDKQKDAEIKDSTYVGFSLWIIIVRLRYIYIGAPFSLGAVQVLVLQGYSNILLYKMLAPFLLFCDFSVRRLLFSKQWNYKTECKYFPAYVIH